MKFLKKYKVLIILLMVFVIGASSLYIINKNKKNSTNIEQPVKELPFKVDLVPSTLNIVDENGSKVLQTSYKNDSEETIYNLRLEIMLKDTGEVVELHFNEVVEPGKSANIFKSKAPKSASIDDVEILKYKISLKSGTYMEYDTKLKQYNWS